MEAEDDLDRTNEVLFQNEAIKKMMHINLDSRVKQLLYSNELDYLTICLEKGNLINLYFEVTE
jgi:hypothetical protein